MSLLAGTSISGEFLRGWYNLYVRGLMSCVTVPAPTATKGLPQVEALEHGNME